MSLEKDKPEDYESITTLDISSKGLAELPSWLSECKKLKNLYFHNNSITHLDNLPQTLEILDCGYNKITHLDNLPLTLEQLYCHNNKITHLDNLPLTIELLYCNDNQITHLDNLPTTLEYLYCYKNPLKYDFEPTLENIRNYINQNTKNKN